MPTTTAQPALQAIQDQATRATARLMNDRLGQLQASVADVSTRLDAATAAQADLDQRIATVEQQLRTQAVSP